MHLVEGGNVVVPLEQSRRRADSFYCSSVQMPDRIEHRMIVCIENVSFELRVAGDMNLCNTLSRDAVYIFEGVEAVILRRAVDVVDVAQNATVRRFDDLVEKFPLCHLGLVKLRIATDVFYGDWDFQEILNLANARSSRFSRF